MATNEGFVGRPLHRSTSRSLIALVAPVAASFVGHMISESGNALDNKHTMNTKNEVSTVLEIDGIITNDPTTIANNLNESFVNIGIL